ncbi:nuclear pore complex protein Nup50 [Arctopsyche grandis]|uniref:nuclear pore complex protein Nup50 n=1 Tax=Arctopsyche grandis TaxID=121162 RepID=UPI00406D8734
MAKRAADRQLTADNWDDDEPQPLEADGRFAPAPTHVLQTRKIKVAARRKLHSQNQHNEQEKKGIFSGFSGFNKSSSTSAASTPSFNFISNLVSSKTDENKTAAMPSLFNSTPKTTMFAEKSTFNNFNDVTKNNNVKEKEHVNQTKTSNEETTLSADKQFTKKNDEYYVNLKNLNISVSEWIKSHVDKNPYCILTPVFDDYINHLKELDKLKQKPKPNEEVKDSANTIPPKFTNNTDKPTINNTIKKDFSLSPSKQVSSMPTTSFQLTPKTDEKSDEFKMKNPMNNNMFSQGFSSTPVSKPSLFSFAQKIESPTSIPFSFGTGKPFTFGNLTQKDTPPPAKATEEENEEDEPPKVTFTPVVEEDSVYSKRCKVFVKKDDNFGDRGVGTLYLKPIKDSEKYQMIVRADTSLGNLILNIVLSDIPMQRMGKNNVMLMCIPTSDAAPPPVPTLLRVKTADEADKLLDILNKYKK